MAIGIIGLGSYLPDRVVTNAEISQWTGVTEDWVEERTGIKERRYRTPGMVTSDLATRAGRRALADGPGIDGLEALIVATCTSDVPQPATAAIVQHKLGIRSVPAFDVNAVCAGFVFSLGIAEGMLAGRPPSATALVIGADMFSTIMNRSDRRTVSLFGDGAGAVVLGRVPDGYGIQALRLVTDGEFNEEIGVEAGGVRLPTDQAARAEGRHLFRMNGPLVKDYVITTLRKLVIEVLDDCGLTLADVDRFVFHQANIRLLENLAADLGLDMARVPTTASRYGNTAGASVPVTLDESHRRSPLRRGERVLLAAAGGGLCAGAALLTWY
ncbi:3-oxoacyl-[acyl-carrier-protein] synthase-3 [Nonomuraea thailandensis]|uniref:3-oxoacyl-[acyl-carrier-protein] synthase-3 n=1 Tax=Nonomuraea thailandensis TaxID=1188745 RepID=A0A9X2GG43_9ACTN|nr:ketoacyl-ACP synthase III [Nonomuraea thailandensis]MCP2353458.1 3-oxoacyl-[acyl-carrier-protein] synthase-3 [Nonomuraea thailandensis]